MKNNVIATTVVIVTAVAIGWFVFKADSRPYSAEALNGFAECLSDKGFTMYGAYWCPHCQNEKKEFGESFSHINYVECTDNPKQCTDAGITGYPTWLGPDSIRLEEKQGVERLSEASGCSLLRDEI